MAKSIEPPVLALVGAETLLGREIRDVFADSTLAPKIHLIAAAEADSGIITEQAGEPALVETLSAEGVASARVVFLAGTPAASEKAAKLAPRGRPVLIDLAGALEDRPEARLRAPGVEPAALKGATAPLHVIAHPAAIALAMFFERLSQRHTISRSVVHVFEPASERGQQGIDELHKQTVSLLSFKPIPKGMFDAQASFNLLARYGTEASASLEDIEARIERHLATLLAHSGRAPMPSLRLVQAPVFHGYSFSLWVEFEKNPGVQALSEALASAGIEVRGGDEEPPTNVGAAGQNGLTVGVITADRNQPRACWFWMVADNLRLAAENAVAVAKQLL
ncbi:MAG: Asd/ArgC dimerization domain-containing protein [Bryobacteraceae bacterium]